MSHAQLSVGDFVGGQMVRLYISRRSGYKYKKRAVSQAITQSVMMSSKTKSLPCLGIPFQLGMLYDCRNDRIVPGVTLWDEKLLKAALSESLQPSASFEVSAEDNLSKKMFNLGVEANLSLSVMSGLVKVAGSAKYLDDRKSSNNQARVTLKYRCTSKFQQLTMEQLATSNIQHPDVFDKGTATHVVTGVLYGAEAFFIFDREVDSDENFREIHGNMEVMVKALPSINEIKGSADLNISDQDKRQVEKFNCKFYGDGFVLKSNPSTFQAAVKVYKELPTYFGEGGKNAVPVEVWLYPLSSLNSRAACMVREISISLVTQTQQDIEAIDDMDMRCRARYRYFGCHSVIHWFIHHSFCVLHCENTLNMRISKTVSSVLSKLRLQLVKRSALLIGSIPKLIYRRKSLKSKKNRHKMRLLHC